MAAKEPVAVSIYVNETDTLRSLRNFSAALRERGGKEAYAVALANVTDDVVRRLERGAGTEPFHRRYLAATRHAVGAEIKAYAYAYQTYGAEGRATVEALTAGEDQISRDAWIAFNKGEAAERASTLREVMRGAREYESRFAARSRSAPHEVDVAAAEDGWQAVASRISELRADKAILRLAAREQRREYDRSREACARADVVLALQQDFADEMTIMGAADDSTARDPKEVVDRVARLIDAARKNEERSGRDGGSTAFASVASALSAVAKRCSDDATKVREVARRAEDDAKQAERDRDACQHACQRQLRMITDSKAKVAAVRAEIRKHKQGLAVMQQQLTEARRRQAEREASALVPSRDDAMSEKMRVDGEALLTRFAQLAAKRVALRSTVGVANEHQRELATALVDVVAQLERTTHLFKVRYT